MLHSLLPQDVRVLAKRVSGGGTRPAIAQLASDLFISPSHHSRRTPCAHRFRLFEGHVFS
jgi:hypothetical protein